MRKRASGRISVTRPSNSKSSSFATLRSSRLAGPTRRALLAVAPRRGVALQEGDGFDAACACSYGLAWLMTAALLVGIAVAAVPVPILAVRRRPGGGVFRRRRLGAPRIGAAIAQRNRQADQLFDVAQERHLLAVAQRDGDACGAGARGAADAMHIGLRHVRQVVIDDVADAVDVDAARGDVGGDQRPDLAVAKRRQHPLALVLRFVAVDRLGGDAGADQTAHDFVGAVLGPGEDQRAVDGLLAQYVDERCRLGGAIDANDALLDLFHRGGGRYDRNSG